MNKRLWGGAFSAESLPLLEEYSNSIAFDWRLAPYDIKGSIAHVTMLGEEGIISAAEAEIIRSGLGEILKEFEAGTLEFSLADEDVHMNVERLLHARIGAVAGKLHTARSRNDQVALDVHLYVRDSLQGFRQDIRALQRVLLARAKEQIGAIMPGYTHLQRAQPILLSHHLMAYAWMLERDFGRFLDCEKRADACPLGAGALAGTTFPIKRERIAELLGFSSIYENSLDAVSDRDFVVECVAASSLCMVHLSRLCEEIVLWTSGEFRFARLHDSYATGSSIMPQKKNADHAELIRGKSGRVFGSLITLLTVLKGLPLAYNKDMQEDKEALFDSVRTLSGALKIMSGMIETMTFNREHMERAAAADFSNATDMADYLARKGMPFREAHEVTAKLVAQCVESGKTLESIPLPDLQSLSSLFQEDIFEALRTERVVSRRTSRGGTAQSRVVEQIERFEKLISLSA